MKSVSRLFGITTCLLIFTSAMAGNVTEQWKRFYDAGGNDDVTDMAIPSDGFVYTTGGSDLNFSIDVILHKYDAAGTKLWTKRYDRASRDDGGVAVAVGTTGDVYVLAYTKDAALNQDITIIKYDSAGNLITSKNWNGGTVDTPRGLALDGSNNVFIVGDTNQNATQDIILLKYDSALTFKGQSFFNGPGNLADSALQIAIRTNLNELFVAGSSRAIGSQEDFLCAKFDLNLGFKWAKTFDGPAGGSDSVNALGIDSTGNPVISGPSNGVGTDSDMWTLKLDQANGNQLWAIRKDGGASKGDNVTDLALDSSDNVYVCGKLNSVASKADMGLVKYNSAGVEQWTRFYSSSGGSDEEEARSVTVDGFGNVYMTGVSLAITTLVYKGDGTWLATLRPVNNTLDRGVVVRTADQGRVYVAGNWVTASATDDMVLIQYKQTTTFTGNLVLNGKIGSAPYPSSVTFSLRIQNTQTVVDSPVATVNTSTGALSVEIVQGNWDLSLKHQSWLRRTQALVSPGGASTLTFSMDNGDAFSDNQVDLLDLNKVLTEFAEFPGSNYTDLDKSGQVDINDLTIVLLNFMMLGDQ